MHKIRRGLMVIAAALMLTACNNEGKVENINEELTTATTNEVPELLGETESAAQTENSETTASNTPTEISTEASTEVKESQSTQVIIDDYNTWPYMLRYGDKLYVLEFKNSWGSIYSLNLDIKNGEPVEVRDKLGKVVDCGANAIPEEDLGINFLSNTWNMTLYKGSYEGEECFHADYANGMWGVYSIKDVRQIQEDGTVTISDVVDNEMIDQLLYVEDVKVIKTTDYRMILEKDGIGREVEWPYVERGTGEWTSGQMLDVNGDGENELVLFQKYF